MKTYTVKFVRLAGQRPHIPGLPPGKKLPRAEEAQIVQAASAADAILTATKNSRLHFSGQERVVYVDGVEFRIDAKMGWVPWTPV
jgi:hypothetical protein